MSPLDDSLSLFYLANVLLVLAVAAVAGWLGPRVALSQWRLSRKTFKNQVESAPLESLDSPPSLDYEDALCATQAGDIHPRSWSLPEISDPLTLKTQPDPDNVETRRAYLKLLQSYSQKPQPLVTQLNDEELPSFLQNTHAD